MTWDGDPGPMADSFVVLVRPEQRGSVGGEMASAPLSSGRLSAGQLEVAFGWT